MSLVRVNLLYMSIYGGILILTVLFLRLLLKKRLPKRTFSILWCMALLRLLVPVSVDAPFSIASVIQERLLADSEESQVNFLAELFSGGLYSGESIVSGKNPMSGENLVSGENSVPGQSIVSGESPEPGKKIMSGKNTGSEGNSGRRETTGGSFPDRNGDRIAGSRPMESGWSGRELFRGLQEGDLLRKAGMTGSVICAAVFLALYLYCLGRFRTALPLEDPFAERWLEGNRLLRKVRVCQSDRISSPLTYGVVRPVILLPKQLLQEDRQKMEYILQHELVHIRRFDGAWKLAMAAALCLHWFNPLVWMMYLFMNRDLELSCDEEVLRIFGTKARKGYALTLIGMEEDRQFSMPLYSGFGKSAVEERVGAIMRYKKKRKIIIVIAAMMVLTVGCIFATTSRAEADPAAGDKDLPEVGAYDALPMDPPVGTFTGIDGLYGNTGSGATTGMDGNAASGAGTGMDGNAASGADTAMDGSAGLGTATGADANGESGSAGGTGLSAEGENTYRLIYMKEGMPESEPAQLVTGPGYGILIPREGWTAFGPDGWMSEDNHEVEFWVANFSAEGSDYYGFDIQQIAEALQGEGYQEENGCYWKYEETNDRMMWAELRRADDQGVWGIFYTCPGEAQEGWGVELRAMAQTFTVIPSGSAGTDSLIETYNAYYREAEERALEAEMTRWLSSRLEAAFVDHASIDPYLADGYDVDTDILDAIREWGQGETHVRFHPTDGHCVASVSVKTTESEEDSNDYLTVEMLKEGEDWKICFMGIEK